MREIITLSGRLLDLAVALAKGYEARCDIELFNNDVVIKNPTGSVWFELKDFSPTVNWSIAGRVIDDHGITVACDWLEKAEQKIWSASIGGAHTFHTVLTAAMRCFVSSKLGHFIQLPNDIVAKLEIAPNVLDKKL